MATDQSELFNAGPNGADITNVNSSIVETTGTVPTFSNVDVYEGAFSADMDTTGATDQSLVRFDQSVATSNGWIVFYFWFDAWPAANMYFLTFRGALNENIGDVRIDSNGKLTLRDVFDGGSATTTAAAAIQTWHRLAVKVTSGTELRMRTYFGANLEGTTPDEEIVKNSSETADWVITRVGITTNSQNHMKVDGFQTTDDGTEPLPSGSDVTDPVATAEIGSYSITRNAAGDITAAVVNLDGTGTDDTGVDTYLWDDNGAGGVFSDNSIADPTWTPPDFTSGPWTLTLTVEDVANNSDSDSVSANVNFGGVEKPVLGFIVPRRGSGIASGLIVGMRNLPDDETSFIATESDWGGTPSGMSRTYTTPAQGILSSPVSEITQDYGDRCTWHSMHPDGGDWLGMANGDYDNNLISFLNAIPSEHGLILSIGHEPENDGRLAEAGDWRNMQDHFYDVIKATRPQTLVGPVLMGWTFDPASGRDPNDWTPSANKMDFFGLDKYNPYKFPMVGAPTTWRDWEDTPVTNFQAHIDALGVVGAVGETACHEDESGIGPSRKVTWIDDMITWCLDKNYAACLWFNAYKPGDTAEPMLLDSSPEVLSKWSEVLTNNPRGVGGSF